MSAILRNNNALASGVWPKARQACQSPARPGLLGFWPGLPEKDGLEKPVKPGQSWAFMATLATQPWKARPWLDFWGNHGNKNQAGLAARPQLPRFFYPLASPAKARPLAVLTPAFRPGFDPGLPQSGQAPDARVAYVTFARQWKSMNQWTSFAESHFTNILKLLKSVFFLSYSWPGSKWITT